MINSAALPKVALSNPPTPSPNRVARCPVAWPIQPAAGMMAMAEQMKIQVALAPAACCQCPISSTIAAGTKTISQLIDGLIFTNGPEWSSPPATARRPHIAKI